ncbi:hypothetical protein C7999DRAFT_14369 [Corynascus novoguineensis]|uniref:Cell wall protein PhiA n=1 Tax=Corynascus novoguineensis TaxID=1126955 RepID=A0AAN7HFE9_9PEZI|nr:hypothetical protein C7999DRAFT_14369 [Corynascus novoguineensis]
MQLSTVILSLFTAAASAAPSCGQRKFGIMALRSASPIHFATVSATKNKLVLNLPEDQVDSECVDGKVHSAATFYIKDEELYLYGTKDRVQQFLVDPSGMGQGVLQYFDKGDSDPSGRLTVKGWSVDQNENLLFLNNSLLACPSTTDNSWYLWVNVGIEKPAGQEGCLGLSARTVTAKDPVKCTYSNYA